MSDSPHDGPHESNCETIERLRPWLSEHIPGASQLAIGNVIEPAQGLSSKTILFTMTWVAGGATHERDLVARIQRHTACPLLADIFHQYRTMQAVAAASDAAVPPLFMAEADASVLGAPFFLMDRVEGRVPPDFPSYHAQGWFADELNPAQRELAWWNGVAAMAQLHRIGWQPFPFLANGAEGPPSAGFYLEHFIGRWFDWAAQGQRYPLLEAALRHLLDHQPPLEQTGLVWNDARMGNTMFARDLSVASLFDFEVASLGPAEIDLAWWLYAEDIFSIQFGIQRIAGIPGRDEAIRGFERLYGRAMPHFDYYEAIAALKHAVISIRDYRNDKKIKRPEALPNFATDRLASYLHRHGVNWESE
jgi:aminoglycoside phosphotransferase (APT) family kinase protein